MSAARSSCAFRVGRATSRRRGRSTPINDKLDKQPTVSVNGKAVSAAPDRTGYVSLDRVWKNGDFIEIEFPLEARQSGRPMRACGRTAAGSPSNAGRSSTALNGPERLTVASLDLLLEATSELKPSFDESLFGGVTVIAGQARRMTQSISCRRKPITLIPYYLWANRGAGEMSVWLPTREYAPGDIGPAGGFIFYENPNSAADGWRYLEAAPFDQSAGAKWGCFRRAIAGARGTAVGTGRQNTEDMLAACPERGTAAQLCANYSLNGVGGWFLPSRDELALMYRNLKAAGAADFRDEGGRQLHLLGVVAADRGHGRAHRLRRCWPPALR